MKSLFFASAVALILAGCTPSSSEPEKTTSAASVAPKTGPAAIIADTKSTIAGATGAMQGLEVGCAKCTYAMPGVTSCAAAVKVAGKAYALEIPGFDAHKEGLCAGAKQAKITGGELKGDKYVATAIELIK